MEDRLFKIRISPENINGDLVPVRYTLNEYSEVLPFDPCCQITGDTVTGITTGITFTYTSMTELLSGGTEGKSLLNLTIPIFLSENIVDIGYYNVFDGLISQKDTLLNFLFSADTINPYRYYFFNTSDIEFKKFLEFCDYQISWGDGTPIQVVTSVSPNYYYHDYVQDGEYEIVMSGMSPWGYNVIKKTVYVPFDNVTIDNPSGEVFFVPSGGNWLETPISYNYIFSGDSYCENNSPCCDFITVPFLVTGYTFSRVNDLEVYGKKVDLALGKFKPGVTVTGPNGSEGVWWGPSPDGLYTAYTINNINYYDYVDGSTVFVVESSGCTSDLICSAITKNEVLMNVISEIEVQSNVFAERGKNTALEYIQRLGEVRNMGQLDSYGYGFFNVIKI